MHNFLAHLCSNDMNLNKCFHTGDKYECLNIFDCLVVDLQWTSLKFYGKLRACLVIESIFYGSIFILYGFQ